MTRSARPQGPSERTDVSRDKSPPIYGVLQRLGLADPGLPGSRITAAPVRVFSFFLSPPSLLHRLDTACDKGWAICLVFLLGPDRWRFFKEWNQTTRETSPRGTHLLIVKLGYMYNVARYLRAVLPKLLQKRGRGGA